MANIDIRGLYENNRRREAHAVVGAVPYNLESGDLREGTPAKTAETGKYNVLTLPANILVTGCNLVITDQDVFDGDGVKVQSSIGSAVVVAETDITKPGVTAGVAADLPVLLTTPQDVIMNMTVPTGARVKECTQGLARLVIEYVDFDRATMSYIGE